MECSTNVNGGVIPDYEFLVDVVALLRPLLAKVKVDIEYYKRILHRYQGLDDDTRRETYSGIIKRGTYSDATKHLALCKVFLQRYGNGITRDVDSANLTRTNLSDTAWNRLLEEDAAIKANNEQVITQAKNACVELENTLAIFKC